MEKEAGFGLAGFPCFFLNLEKLRTLKIFSPENSNLSNLIGYPKESFQIYYIDIIKLKLEITI